LLPITHERGYLIPAIGKKYVDCAERLRTSILLWHPEAHVTILTEDRLPYGNQGGFANDWQCFAASPYRQTVKLEADILCTSPIDHWWTMFENRDVVISQGCRDYYDQPSTARHYRKIFDANNLPDVYNAITYWRVSKTAQEFFQLVRIVFEHWDKYRTLLKFPDQEPTTDVVYAVVATIMGPETVTLPLGLGPQIVHMKQQVIGTTTTDWTQELTWEHTNPGLRINTVAQWGLVHYYQKDWQ
jgi:hypothetical protein